MATANDELAIALRTSVTPLTVKQLRKHKVKTVQVIERSRFLEALSQVAESQEKKEPASKRRIERLLQEVEKLGREVILLVEGGELAHPGLLRGVERIREQDARIE